MGRSVGILVVAGLVALVGLRGGVHAQGLPNPYRIAEGWAQLPNGKAMGAVGKAVTDPDGRRLTYQQAAKRVRRWAGGLAAPHACPELVHLSQASSSWRQGVGHGFDSHPCAQRGIKY